MDKLDRRSSFTLLYSSYFMIRIISFSAYIYKDNGMSLAYLMPIFCIFEFVIGLLTFKLFYKIQSVLSSHYFFTGIALIFLADLILIGERLPLYVTHDWIAVPFFLSYS